MIGGLGEGLAIKFPTSFLILKDAYRGVNAYYYKILTKPILVRSNEKERGRVYSWVDPEGTET